MPGAPEVEWDITARELLDKPTFSPISAGLYRGRLPDPALEGTVDLNRVDPTYPHEHTADGCPGGWYRTAYCNSVSRYVRERTTTGNRVTNPFFESASWQVQEAVMYLEREQARWHAHRAEVDHGRYQAAHPPDKKRGNRGSR